MAAINSNESITRGWYYDNQKDPKVSPLTTVALYYNTKWVTSNSGEGSKESSSGGAQNGEWKTDGFEKGTDGYSKEPLCTSILSEDFTVSVSNHWSDFGGDPLSELWDRAKPLAPFAKLFSDAVKRVNEKIDQGETGEGTVSNGLSKLFQKLGDLDTNKITGYLNRKLIVQGTRFSYYGGTDISFGSLGMKFTIFPDFDSSGKVLTVNKQLEQIYPYTIGKFVQEDLVKELKTYIGWQISPGGFKPDSRSVDKIQEGTLKLEIGPYYSIPNLLVQDAQFVYSKQMVKIPTTTAKKAAENESQTNLVSPLYCDVNLIFRPATKFSDDSMKKFVNGFDRTSTLSTLNTTLQNKLKSTPLS